MLLSVPPSANSASVDTVDISVVIPCYNEEQNLDYLFDRLESVLGALNLNYEIVCVNDGSRDNTLNCLVQHHYRNPAIKVVNLSRNFGKEIAMTAGIDHTKGATVVPIDADLQDPPELIELLLEKWREGYDVVYGKRRSRQGESWLKRLTAGAFYRVMGHMTSVPIPQDTGDFRLMDRKVVEALQKLPERTRFMKGLFAWVGFKQTYILYDRPQRYKGTTNWNYWRLWNFAVDGIASFSLMPLKVWTYLGLILSLVSFLYAAYLILRTIILGIDVPGYASLMVAILFMGGMQLVTMGVLGEYLGRVYEEVKGRPLYLIRDRYGFGEEPETHGKSSS